MGTKDLIGYLVMLGIVVLGVWIATTQLNKTTTGI